MESEDKSLELENEKKGLESGGEFLLPESDGELENDNQIKKPWLKFILVSMLIVVLGGLVTAYGLSIKNEWTEAELTQQIENEKILDAIEPGSLSGAFPPKKVYFALDNQLVYLDEASGEIVKMELPGEVSEWGNGSLSYREADDKIYLVIDGEVTRIDKDGGNLERLTQTQGQVDVFKLAPKGDLIYVDVIDHWTACCGNPEPNFRITKPWILDLATGQMTEIMGLEDLRSKWDDEYIFFKLIDWLPDGDKLLVYGGEPVSWVDDNVWEVDVKSGKVSQFDRYGEYPKGELPTVNYSPVSDYFAYHDDERGYIVNGQTGEKSEIEAEGLSWDAAWSPNGEKLAVVQKNVLLTFTTDGEEERRVTLEGVEIRAFPGIVWARDENLIGANASKADNFGVLVLKEETGEASFYGMMEKAERRVKQIFIGGDSVYLVCTVDNKGGQTELWRAKLSGGEVELVAEGVRWGMVVVE